MHIPIADILTYLAILFMALYVVGCWTKEPEKVAVEAIPIKRKRKSGAKVLESFYAIVVRVIDGDSLRARMKDGKEVTIRLAYGDSPEMHQKYGPESKQNLEKMVQPGMRIKGQPTMRNPSYGRIVALVSIGEADLTRYQIETGYMHVDPRYNKLPELVTKEAEARAQRLGLWKQKNPVLPSAWRKEQKLKRAA